MGFSYKKGMVGNFAMGTMPTILDNSEVFFKAKQGIPKVLSTVGTLMSGWGLGAAVSKIAGNVASQGLKASTPLIVSKVAKKAGEKGGAKVVNTFHKVFNPYNK